jgi:hypothetical protein
MSFLAVELLTVILFFVLSADEKAKATKSALPPASVNLAARLVMVERGAILETVDDKYAVIDALPSVAPTTKASVVINELAASPLHLERRPDDTGEAALPPSTLSKIAEPGPLHP